MDQKIVNVFSFVPKYASTAEAIWGECFNQRDLYTQMLESYVRTLEDFMDIKDKVINELKTQIAVRERIITNQNDFIDVQKNAASEAEMLNTLFINLFASLKEAKNSKEFKEILKDHNVVCENIPLLN